MKRNEVKTEHLLRLPAGSEKEMEEALRRVYDRLRSNETPAGDSDVTGGLFDLSCSLNIRWKPVAIIAAAVLLVVVVLGLGIQWRRRIGTFLTTDGASHQVYQATMFGQKAGVLTLRDGSRVEIRQGSRVSLERMADGVNIRLDEGSIIVNAVKQHRGHLYVQTKDMTVSVVGTVFVVRAEKAGSRVAVVQGEVAVLEGAAERQLHPGEHLVTYVSKELPSVREEVSWSPHAEEHLALFQQTTTLRSTPVPEWQEAAGGKMSFEVASVRPSESRDLGLFPLSHEDTYKQTGGYFRASFPLTYYIAFAYKLTPERRDAWLAQLPKWTKVDYFAIEARAPIAKPTKDQMRLMVQSLLADRFRLAVHYEPQDVPVFALELVTPGKLGPQIQPHSQGPPCPTKGESEVFASIYDANVWPIDCGSVTLSPPGRPAPPVVKKASANNILFAGRDVSLESFFSDYMGRPIVNETGLTGTFDFRLEYAPEFDSIWLKATPTAPTGEPQGPDYLEALKEQLGMKLESTKAWIPVLEVDHVEKPSEN
jgi:uncharacterized protein (TIGR03435 family)